MQLLLEWIDRHRDDTDPPRVSVEYVETLVKRIGGIVGHEPVSQADIDAIRVWWDAKIARAQALIGDEE